MRLSMNRLHLPNKIQIPFFRIFYSTTFSILLLLVIALLLITPGDTIFQAYKNNQLYNVFVITGVYFLTLIIIILLYATRIYTTRTALLSIPKAWIPIENGDVKKSVRRIILKGLARSAGIAFQARPKEIKHAEDRSQDIADQADGLSSKALAHKSTWAAISHPGWSSPSSRDFPNLHYDPIVLELPNLIEAKAVSLAPVTNYFSTLEANEGQLIQPDPLAVSVLQRPPTMGLRDYFAHLTSLDMIMPPSIVEDFLALYERARFSGVGLDENIFRALMGSLAEILRAMKEPDRNVITRFLAEEEEANIMAFEKAGNSSKYDRDQGSLSSSGTVQRKAMPEYDDPDNFQVYQSRNPSHSTSHYSMHSFPETPPGLERQIYSTPHQYQTSRQPSLMSSLSVSSRSTGSPPDLSRVQTGASEGSSMRSGGSVIRLAGVNGGVLDLPYTIVNENGVEL